MMDANAIQVRDRGAVPSIPVAHHGGAVGVPIHRRRARRRPWRPCWRCWSRRPRTGGSAASAGCAPRPDCRRARPGRPSSTTVCPWLCGRQLGELASGSFVDRGVNVLAFGLPGTGKTHAPVLASWATGLVRQTLGRIGPSSPRPTGWCRTCSAAKRDLALPRQLRKLDNYDFLLLDDLGYLPQGLPKSPRCSSTLDRRTLRTPVPGASRPTWSFSQWEHIFANPMATAAAIDRVVHHSVIAGIRRPQLPHSEWPSSAVRNGR